MLHEVQLLHMGHVSFIVRVLVNRGSDSLFHEFINLEKCAIASAKVNISMSLILISNKFMYKNNDNYANTNKVNE